MPLLPQAHIDATRTRHTAPSDFLARALRPQVRAKIPPHLNSTKIIFIQ